MSKLTSGKVGFFVFEGGGAASSSFSSVSFGEDFFVGGASSSGFEGSSKVGALGLGVRHISHVGLETGLWKVHAGHAHSPHSSYVAIYDVI